MKPHDLGLDGTGTFDNTDALTRMLSVGQPVHLPSGLYRIKPGFVFPPGSRITGNSHAALTATVAGSGQQIGAHLSSGCVIESLTFMFDHLAQLPEGSQHLLLHGHAAHGCRLTDVVLQGPGVNEKHKGRSNNGLHAVNCDWLTVDRLSTSGNLTYGIELHGGGNVTLRGVHAFDNGCDGIKLASDAIGLQVLGGRVAGNGRQQELWQIKNGNGIDVTAANGARIVGVVAAGNWGTGIQIKTTGTAVAGAVGDVVIDGCLSENHPAGKNGFAIIHDTGGSGDHVIDPVQRPVTQRVLLRGCIARDNTGSGFHLGAGTPGGCGAVVMSDLIAASNKVGVNLMPGARHVMGHGWILQGNGTGKQYNLTLRGKGHRLSGVVLDGIDQHKLGSDPQARYNVYAADLDDCVLSGVQMSNAIDRDVRIVGHGDAGDGLPDPDVLQLLGANWDRNALFT